MKKIKCSYTNPLHIQEEQIIEEQRNQLLKKNINFETYMECAKTIRWKDYKCVDVVIWH